MDCKCDERRALSELSNILRVFADGVGCKSKLLRRNVNSLWTELKRFSLL